MEFGIRELTHKEFPALTSEMNDPPEKLYISGNLPDSKSLFLCVVGSRKATDYGKEVCRKVINGLSGYAVTVVSGLALGIDAEAHRQAIKAGLKTVAVPGSGLNRDVIYPKSHLSLAREIVNSGGALLSEFEPDFRATAWSFPKRNRIMAGMSHGVLVIEAQKRSGTLITARLGLEYNREVLAVPGSIFSSGSEGTNSLIKDGAHPVTSAEDLVEVFSLAKEKDGGSVAMKGSLSEQERSLMEMLKEPISKNELIALSKRPVTEVSATITSLEIKGRLTESNGILYPEHK